ncbi:hypothetical protein ACFVXG_16440 [Kitasatospora sp. NPDC058162]|uniref:hypothetical protein n=1 Tax=Kitasatospora sp. NPDC058162 TaxID=3346362 RepID=UPI0036D8F2A0
MPPVPGLLRAAVYTGLLVLCLVDHPSPLHSAKIVAGTEQVFYTPVGVMRLLGLRRVDPRVLTLVARLTVGFWIAAAAGLLQPVSGILAFLGFAFLHMVNAGALGANHSTHSAVYTMFALCFSVSYDFSADRLLADHTGWPRLVSEHSVFTSGFAPLLLLCFLAYTMLAGGVAKLRYGGPRWLGGKALRFYLEQSAVAARWPWLSRQVVARPGVCRVFAVAAVAIELSAPLAVVDSTLRMPVILSWTCLHIGILLLMMPAYWVQMCCYLLLLDWPWIASLFTGHRPDRAPVAEGGGAVALAVFGSACVLLLGYVLVRESEQWPLTSVPMYSNGAPADAPRPPARDELHARAVRAARGRHAAWQRAWVIEEVMEDIWIRPADGGEGRPLFLLLHEHKVAGFVRWSQYTKVVREIAVEDVAAKPADHPEAGVEGTEYPATRFLRELAPVIRKSLPDWERYDRLELVCRTDSGGVVIGRAQLAEQPALTGELRR